MLTRVVGKHCETGDVVVKDAWLPADLRRATCSPCRDRRLLPLDGLQLQPRRRARRWSRSGRASPSVVRRETEDDLLATRLGDLSR